MRIELHYHTGGHGGPYYGSATAIDRAVALLKGSPTERTIDLRDGVGGPVIASVSKHRGGVLITYNDGQTEWRGRGK